MKQFNPLSETWEEFFGKHRLGFLLDKMQNDPSSIAENFEVFIHGKALLDALPQFFSDITPVKASLLHGDLTTANWNVDEQGNIVVFDPVSLYGHSEFELSIMTLWGNPVPAFYEEYHSVIPKPPKFEMRQVSVKTDSTCCLILCYSCCTSSITSCIT